MVTAIRRGPRARARRQRAASYISATVSGAAGYREDDRGRALPVREQQFRIAGPKSLALSSVGHSVVGQDREVLADLDSITAPLAFTRLCLRSIAALMLPEARGYLRVTSPRAVQAASFSLAPLAIVRAAARRPGLWEIFESGGHPRARLRGAAGLLALEELSLSQYCESAIRGSLRCFARAVHGLSASA